MKTRFILIPEQPRPYIQNIWNNVLRYWTLIPVRGKTIETALQEFLGHSTRRGTEVEPRGLHIEDTSGSLGRLRRPEFADKVMRRRATQQAGSGSVKRAPPESSADFWSAQVAKTQSQEKYHQKGTMENLMQLLEYSEEYCLGNEWGIKFQTKGYSGPA